MVYDKICVYYVENIYVKCIACCKNQIYFRNVVFYDFHLFFSPSL